MNCFGTTGIPNMYTIAVIILIQTYNVGSTLTQIRVEGFVLKKLLTYFEMLIVPHALQCVDGCFFVAPALDIVLYQLF